MVQPVASDLRPIRRVPLVSTPFLSSDPVGRHVNAIDEPDAPASDQTRSADRDLAQAPGRLATARGSAASRRRPRRPARKRGPGRRPC